MATIDKTTGPRLATPEPEHLLCPVTQVMLRDPVMASSGNTYERIALLSHWRQRGRSHDPLTNADLASGVLISNWGKRREVRDFLEKYPDYIPEGWTSRIVPPPQEDDQWTPPILAVPKRDYWNNLSSFLIIVRVPAATLLALGILLSAILLANPVILTHVASICPLVQRLAAFASGPRIPRGALGVAVLQASGYENILSSMFLHPDHPSLQGNACAALSNLADENDMRTSIIEAFGIEHVLSAMKSHPEDPYVQAGASGALWAFAMNNTARHTIAQLGGVSHILLAMRSHLDDHWVQAEASGALWGLASNVDNRDLIVRDGGIETIIAAMRAHLKDALVQRQACGVLGHVAGNSAEHRHAVAHAGGVNHTITAMQRHPKDTWVQRNGCVLLAYFPLEEGGPDVDIQNLLSAAGLKCPDF